MNKNENVFNSKKKNWSIQYCFCHIKFNNHQFDFITKIWRKAFAKNFLINIVFEFKLMIVSIVLSIIEYSVVSKTLKILSLIDFLNKWNKWWIFHSLLLNLNVNSKKNDDVFKIWIQMKNVIMCLLIFNVFCQNFKDFLYELRI